MGFDFDVIVLLLLSHCSFSLVLGCGVSYFGGFQLLSMVVQQLVAFWVFSHVNQKDAQCESCKLLSFTWGKMRTTVWGTAFQIALRDCFKGGGKINI